MDRFLQPVDEMVDAQKVFDSLKDENGVVNGAAFVTWYVSAGIGSKKRTADGLSSSSSSSSSSSGAPAAKKAALGDAGVLTEAKKKALLKGLVASLKTAIKAKKFYNHGGSEECTVDAVMAPSEFHAMFGALGNVLAKVDKEGKVKKESAVVTNKHLSEGDVAGLFGTLLGELKVNTFSKPRSFEKQVKTGSEVLTVGDASLTYSNNTQTLKMKIKVSNEGTGGGYYLGGFW